MELPGGTSADHTTVQDLVAEGRSSALRRRSAVHVAARLLAAPTAVDDTGVATRRHLPSTPWFAKLPGSGRLPVVPPPPEAVPAPAPAAASGGGPPDFRLLRGLLEQLRRSDPLLFNALLNTSLVLGPTPADLSSSKARKWRRARVDELKKKLAAAAPKVPDAFEVEGAPEGPEAMPEAELREAAVHLVASPSGQHRRTPTFKHQPPLPRLLPSGQHRRTATTMQIEQRHDFSCRKVCTHWGR